MKESAKSRKKYLFWIFEKNLKFCTFFWQNQQSSHQLKQPPPKLQQSPSKCSKHLCYQQRSPLLWAAVTSMKLKKTWKSSKHLLIKHQIIGGGCYYCWRWLLFLPKIEVQNFRFFFQKFKKRYFFSLFADFS